MLRSVHWYMVTDVSRKPFGLNVKGQAVQEESLEPLCAQFVGMVLAVIGQH